MGNGIDRIVKKRHGGNIEDRWMLYFWGVILEKGEIGGEKKRIVLRRT